MASGLEEACDGNTVEEIVSMLEERGYTGQFAAREPGRLLCFTCHRESDPDEVDLRALCRTEGASDPDDMLAVVAIVCPRCGAKGTAALNYGPEATAEGGEVLRRLHDRRSGRTGPDD